jgi:hypothetical protein
MTTTYRYGDHGYWDALASPSMRELVERARSLGWKFGPRVMSDGERTDVPIVALVELPPNGVLPRHRRDCDRFEVVIRGSIAVGDGVVFGPGDVETSKAGKFYGPHVAGPEGALVVEVFARADRMEIEFEDPQGALEVMERFAIVTSKEDELTEPRDSP